MIPNLDFLDRVSVLVVGDIMLDRYVWGDVRRISPEAPVPVVEVQRETHTAGGAANVAVNLAALGVRCGVFGLMGDDVHGRELDALFVERGISYDRRLVSTRVPTITKTRIIAQRQQVCRLDQEAGYGAYSLEANGFLDLLAEQAAKYDAIILSDYAKGVLGQAVVDRMRAVRTERGCFLALDPKPSRPLEIGGFDLITPNRAEAAQLAKLSDFERASLDSTGIARRVIELHAPKCLVMTLSEHGMLLSHGGGAPRIFPTVARQVADVSGAGDTVVAVLTAAMAAGVAPEAAVQVANSAAGVVVGKLGTATVSRQELWTATSAL